MSHLVLLVLGFKLGRRNIHLQEESAPLYVCRLSSGIDFGVHLFGFKGVHLVSLAPCCLVLTSRFPREPTATADMSR